MPRSTVVTLQEMVVKKFRDSRLLVVELLRYLPVWCSEENFEKLNQKFETVIGETSQTQLSFDEVIELLVSGGVKIPDIESFLGCIPDLSSYRRKTPRYYASKLKFRYGGKKTDGIDSFDV